MQMLKSLERHEPFSCFLLANGVCRSRDVNHNLPLFLTGVHVNLVIIYKYYLVLTNLIQHKFLINFDINCTASLDLR